MVDEIFEEDGAIVVTGDTQDSGGQLRIAQSSGISEQINEIMALIVSRKKPFGRLKKRQNLPASLL